MSDSYVSNETAEHDQAQKETAEDNKAPKKTTGHDHAQKETADLFRTALDVAAASAGAGTSGYNNRYDESKGNDKGKGKGKYKGKDKDKDTWRKGKGKSKDTESKGKGKCKDYNEICEVVMWLHATAHKQARIIIGLQERMIAMEEELECWRERDFW
jgi:hypothetical protein